MQHSEPRSTTEHTPGHWVLTILAVVVLLGQCAFLAWFGPERADLAFVMWGLCTGPLMIAAYDRTQIRVLLFAAILLLLLAAAMASVVPIRWRVNSEPAFYVITAILVVLPVLWTVLWLARFHNVVARQTPLVQRQLAGLSSLLVILALIVGYRWTSNQYQEQLEEPRDTLDYAGCYDIHLGRWIPSTMAGHGAQGIVPMRLELDTTRGSLPDSAGRSEVNRGDEIGQRLVRPGWFGAAYWRPLEGQKVEVVWTTGLNGVVMQLRPDGPNLRGMVIGHTDVGDVWPEPRARVRATRVKCDDRRPAAGVGVATGHPTRAAIVTFRTADALRDQAVPGSGKEWPTECE